MRHRACRRIEACGIAKHRDVLFKTLPAMIPISGLLTGPGVTRVETPTIT